MNSSVLTHCYACVFIHESVRDCLLESGPVVTVDQVPRGKLQQVLHSLHTHLQGRREESRVERSWRLWIELANWLYLGEEGRVGERRREIQKGEITREK